MKRAALVLCLISTPAAADYVRIGPGPSLEYAKAYCDNAALMAPQPGMFVYGSPSYVGGASLGYGIGSVIRQSRIKNNCMIMNGWKWRAISGEKKNVKQNWTSHKD